MKKIIPYSFIPLKDKKNLKILKKTNLKLE